MPVNKAQGDAQPLFRPVGEQPLVASASVGQPEAEGTEEQNGNGGAEEQETPSTETMSTEKGPLERLLDKAQEGGWVYDSVANLAREKGLVSKADETIKRLQTS